MLAYVVVDMLELLVEHFRSKDILEVQHLCSTLLGFHGLVVLDML